MASIRQIFSYSTALGLAAQSGRFHHSMNEHLLQLAAHSERATALHAQSGEDALLASEREEEAGLYTNEAAELQEDATALRTRAEKDRAAGTAAAERGAELEEEAAAMEAKAKEDEALAASDAEASEALHVKAETAHAVAIEDTTAANADDAEATELTATAEEERAGAAAAAEEAAAEEAIFDTEEAAGIAEAEAAAEAEEMEEIDAGAVATCEFIPLLDVVCNVVGGVAGVGFQVAAAAAAAESVADFAAAAAAKAEEDAALAEAEELTAKATVDEDSALALREKAEEERAKAEVEEEEAQQDEVEADSKLALSEEEQARAEAEEAEAEELEAEAKESEEEAAKDEAQATEEEAQATEEEAAAEEKSAQAEAEEAQATEEEGKAEAEEAEGDGEWEESVKHGLAAFWNATLSAVVSLSAGLFFGVRLLFRLVQPGIASFKTVVGRTLASSGSDSGGSSSAAGNTMVQGEVAENTASFMPATKTLSYGTLHVCSLAASILPFAGQLAHFGSYTPKGRGGLIILIACVAAFVQSFIMHLVPHVGTKAKEHMEKEERKRKNFTSVVLHIVKSGGKIFLTNFVYLAPLVTIELLVLWVNFGRHSNDKKTEKDPSELWHILLSCLLWTIFLAGAGFHIWYYELNSKATKGEFENGERLDNSTDEEDYFICEKNVSFREGNESEMISLLSEEKMSYYEERSIISNDRELDYELNVENEKTSTTGTNPEKPPAVHPITQYFYDLQLPFEILVISCMIALIGSCFPNVRKLHSTFKAMGGGFSIPKIAIPIIWCLFALTALCTLIFCLARRKPKREARIIH